MKQLMLVMTDENVANIGPGFFSALGIEFLEVTGMNIEGQDYQILVTPTQTCNSVPELEVGSIGEINANSDG